MKRNVILGVVAVVVIVIGGWLIYNQQQQLSRLESEKSMAEKEKATAEEEARKGQAAADRFISIGTGGPTGVYFVVGNAVCRMVHK